MQRGIHMKMKKSLAWILALVLIIGSVNPVFAMDNQLFTDGDSLNSQAAETKEEDSSVFTDGGQTSVPDVTETPKMQDAPEETKEAAALLGDTPEDPWAEATVITELNKEVEITSVYDNVAYYNFIPKEDGTYRITETICGNQSIMLNPVKANISYRFRTELEQNEVLTVKIEKIKAIRGIQMSLPEPFSGYAELGGNSIYNRLAELNPMITVIFEDGQTEKFNYAYCLENNFSFYIELTGEGDANKLTKGEYRFRIVYSYDPTVKSEEYTYLLKDLTDLQVPEISGTQTISVPELSDQKYVFKIVGRKDTDQIFQWKYKDSFTTEVYNQEGDFVYNMNSSFHEILVPQNENYYVVVTCSDENITTLPVDIVGNFELDGEGSIVLMPEPNGEASFTFRPEEDGVYQFTVPKEILTEFSDISVYDGDHAEGTSFEGEYSRFYSKDTAYTITLTNLKQETEFFTLTSVKKPYVVSLEITDGLDKIRTKYIYGTYGLPDFSSQLGELNLQVRFSDNTVLDNIKVGTPFLYEGEEFTVDTKLLKRPDVIDGNEEKASPGEYLVGFWVPKNLGGKLINEPDPISIWVKRANEFTEEDFPVLKFGTKYSLTDFEKNYGKETQYVFILKPEKTGEYDFSELYFSIFQKHGSMDIITKDGSIQSFVANNIGLEKGETYLLIITENAEALDFDFQINDTVNEILDFQLMNSEILDNVTFINELVGKNTIKNVLKNLKFKVTYRDSSGKQQNVEMTLNNTQWTGLINNIDVLYDDSPNQTGEKTLTFYPNDMKKFAVEQKVDFCSLEDVEGILPQIQADGNSVNLEDNYNLAKCFTFTPEESGTYVFDFGIQTVVHFLDPSGGNDRIEDHYCENFRIEANAGITYSFCVTSQYAGEQLDAISLKRYESLNKLEIVNESDIPKKWGQYLGVPEELKKVKIRYTLNNGDTGEIYYGQELPGYGRMNVMAADGEYLGDFELYFYFENMPEVTSENVSYSYVPVSELGLPELKLDHQIIVKKETEYFWVTTFTPDHDGTFCVKFSEAIEDGDVYTEDEEYFQPLAGSDFTGEFTKDTTYVFRMKCSDPDTQLFAKIVETTVRSISLDTSELTIAPGQTGTVIALLEPVTATEELKWTIEPADSGFSIESTENSLVVIKAAENIEANTTAKLTVSSVETGHKAECILETANITAAVDKISSNVTKAPTEIKAGIAVDTSGSDKESDAKKAENDLKEIISNTADSGNAMSGVEFVPEESTENVAEKIKENVDQGGSIVTNVNVKTEVVENSDPKEQITQTVQSQLPDTKEDELSIEKKLDITIDVNSINSDNETEKIGSITQLPKDKAITFTVLLTEEQINTKMYVAYSHNGQIKMVPESDTTQNGAVLTFKANQFSDYFLVSRNSSMKVTYKNITPGGNGLSISSDFGAKLTKPTITVPSNYEFEGWKIEGTNQYWNFDTDVVKTDLTLVGVWSYDPPEPSVTYYTVRFDSQGGTNVSSQSLTYGSKVKEPSAPEKEGFIFGGWYKEASCKNSWDFTKDTVTSSITLYAKWTEKPEIIPETPQIKGHTSQKGYLKIELTDAAKDADYYEYAYSTKEDWAQESDYTVFAQTKNTSAESTKIPAGVYVVKVRSIKQTEEKKIYSSWSSAEWVELPTGVLSAPKILNVKAEKNTVTVVLDRVQGIQGYDCVLGNSTNPVKPVDYAYVEKNQRTTTIVFKNVTDGHYYVGAHAYAYEKGTKVFSKWSNQMEITVDSGEMPEITDLGQPEILKTYSNKGCLKVKLAKPVKDADGYEYAYSTDYGEWLDNDFTVFGRTTKGYCETGRISAGIYTVRARAYQNIDGKRVYGEWSDARWIEIPTASAQLPEILKVKVSKNTVTVTVKKIKGAKGYDCVLGNSYNPIKPTDYEYVEKNKTATTIVFKNVKEGTYYLGTHAYNIRGGKKIFSKWSGVKKITVK